MYGTCPVSVPDLLFLLSFVNIGGSVSTASSTTIGASLKSLKV